MYIMRKIVLLFTFAASFNTFSQSKKVVIAENDSLKTEVTSLQQQLKDLQSEVEASKLNTSKEIAKNDESEFLYSVGVLVGSQIGQKGLGPIDFTIFNSGFYAGYTKNQEGTLENYSQVVRAFDQKILAIELEKQKKEGEAFLIENAKKEGITVLPSGLQYEVIKEGSGVSPTAESQVTVHYTGKTLDGSVFDSSVERGQPATFGLSQVIKGWTEGVALMKPGATYVFYIPSELAYGERGAGENIPPNATLIFDVELIKVGTSSIEEHDHSDPNHKH